MRRDALDFAVTACSLDRNRDDKQSWGGDRGGDEENPQYRGQTL
jgi:hypothetical protein